MSEVTQLLEAISHGDQQATADLLPLVYQELRALAARKLSQEKPGQTLQATALVHEAYLRLVGNQRQAVGSADDARWDGRGHFFAAAAEAMRRILIDGARRKSSAKHGGEFQRVDLDEARLVVSDRRLDLIALDEALDRLAARDPRKAELVKLRFFAGLSSAQAATALGISESTADADWAYAKAWLRLQMAD